ncbi:MAG: tRNA uridine-5-carboxymethylaminomethyl(34) synthesis GTPase MnmE [Flavobacteriia bacterium]|nr:tRNA uridine-5-carboxymethylaminomethyl(34) synthesis GTPase MnmE [Flavobacteriia bacterium]
MILGEQDTICALASTPGKSAISILRVSGKNSIDICEKIFSKKIKDKKSHTLHFGKIGIDKDNWIDEVLVSVFHHNKSFTGEESVEISCHGSTYIQQEILSLLIKNGCRLAKAGEFTMRAFLNGKMDLTQAEAVTDLISSENKKAHEIAVQQMKGGFSNELALLREKMIQFASLLELELDFVEEDIEFADRSSLISLIEDTDKHLQQLISSFEYGNAIKNGVPVAIIGAPNTGKSTLLNQLLGEERAIVSNIAGTTRDSIEEILNIDGIAFRLIDTAGIRESNDEIEVIGINKSKEKIKLAKLILLMNDNVRSIEDTKEWVHLANTIHQSFPEKKILLVMNKIDLFDYYTDFTKELPYPLIGISAKTGIGIEELKSTMLELFQQEFDSQSVIISNVRHLEALQKGKEALSRAKKLLLEKVSNDFIALDIRDCLHHIGSITGGISHDNLLEHIFSRFCIGK